MNLFILQMRKWKLRQVKCLALRSQSQFFLSHWPGLWTLLIFTHRHQILNKGNPFQSGHICSLGLVELPRVSLFSPLSGSLQKYRANTCVLPSLRCACVAWFTSLSHVNRCSCLFFKSNCCKWNFQMWTGQGRTQRGYDLFFLDLFRECFWSKHSSRDSGFPWLHLCIHTSYY